MLGWPLAEALLAFERVAREQQLHEYNHQMLLYALGGLKERPKRPRLLDR